MLAITSCHSLHSYFVVAALNLSYSTHHIKLNCRY